jgi:dGTP triphosphohydrolase
MQLARQLGLNVELCIAAAALHDIGHPAGGHTGEQVLFERTGRRFQHHVFSLSLAEIFGLNLLKEVMECSFYHKSGGENLAAPQGKPQEYGIVRLADKISYCPWDMFDSIANGYLGKEEVRCISRNSLGRDIFEILGQNAMTWIWTLTRAAVKESAEAHRVRFSEKSGEIYAALKESRRIVFERVHPKIHWGSLRAQLEMAYDKIERSFPEIRDVAPIVAYITDQELVELTKLIENEPKDKHLSLEYLKAQGFGFSELIERIKRIKRMGEDTSLVYYQSLGNAS